MKSALKQSVRDKFASIELDAGQTATIEQRIEAARTALWHHGSRPWYFRWPAAATGVIILGICGLLFQQAYHAIRANTLLEAIASEVVENHLKLKPLEVQSDSLREVLRYFDRLDFQPLDSPRIAADPGDRLLGGRYCSIQGIAAAQLRVKTTSGELGTVYQVALPQDQLQFVPDIEAGDRPAVIETRGVRVSIWQERGIVLVDAR